MSNINIIRKIESNDSFRARSIIDRHELNVDIPVLSVDAYFPYNDNPWNVGVIVGGSGTGKTTIIKEVFGANSVENYEYKAKSVIDDMPEIYSVDEIGRIFNSVGFGTLWNWLKPYSVLSNGEKMRVDLARSILDDKKIIVFDEFTSVVDRDVAKMISISIGKCIRRLKKQFVAVTCHRDVLNWIEADWVFDTDKQEFFFTMKTKEKLENLSTYKYINAIEDFGQSLKTITI